MTRALMLAALIWAPALVPCPSGARFWREPIPGAVTRHRTNIRWEGDRIAGRVRCMCSDCTVCDGRGWFLLAEWPSVKGKMAKLQRALAREGKP